MKLLITSATNKIAYIFLPKNKCFSRFKKNLDGNKNNVYLTFDDGPDPEHTPRVLDHLSVLNAKATFFVLGRNAVQYPNIIRRILSEGHSIGTHSWDHLDVNEVSPQIWINDVRRACVEVENIVGCAVNLFRPPYGNLTPRTLFYLLRSNHVTAYWSHDPKDFEMGTSQQLCSWFACHQPPPGSIVLMHDNLEVTSKSLRDACSLWKNRVSFMALPMMR